MECPARRAKNRTIDADATIAHGLPAKANPYGKGVDMRVAAIFVAGRSDTLEEGVRAAETAVDSGAAARALDGLIALTEELAPVA